MCSSIEVLIVELGGVAEEAIDGERGLNLPEEEVFCAIGCQLLLYLPW